MTTDLFGSPSADQVCHDLLLRLAGRVPDELLWRLRDWLAAQSRSALAATLPRELMRHRVRLTEQERELLATVGNQWGASPRLVDAVLSAETPEQPTVEFREGALELDTTVLGLLAVVRGHPGCVQLLQAWRAPLPAGRARVDQRVVLVRGGDRPWQLTGTLQRLLRAHGERTPCVEVLAGHGEPATYHRAAITTATRVWSASSAIPVGV